jgi:hypothetical protein
LLTTLINGAITEWIYGKLNIDAPSKYDAELALSVLENLEQNKIESTVVKLRKNWFCKFISFNFLDHDARWDTVLGIVPDLSKITILHGRVGYDRRTSLREKRNSASETLRKNLMFNDRLSIPQTIPETERNFERFEDDGKDISTKCSKDPSILSPELDDESMRLDCEREEKVRCVFLTALKASYDHQFARGYIGSQTREGLMEAADVGLECGPSSFIHSTRFPTDIPSSQKVSCFKFNRSRYCTCGRLL